MQKRHFEEIAAIISGLSPDIREEVAEAFSGQFANKHERFQEIKFLKACGISDHGIQQILKK